MLVPHKEIPGLLKKYPTYLEGEGMLPLTVKAYCRALANFVAKHEISEDGMIEYIHEINRSPYMNRQGPAALKLFLKMIKKGNIYYNLPKIKPKRRKNSGNYYNRETVIKIINNIEHPGWCLAAEIQDSVGCRVSEVVGLRRSQIKGDSKGDIILVLKTKGRKDRKVYLPVEVERKLKTYLKLYKGEFLFMRSHSKDDSTRLRTCIRYYQRHIKRSADSLGLTFASHDFRRNFAQDLRKKVSVKEKDPLRVVDIVKQALGHSDSSTTMRYFEDVPLDTKKFVREIR